MGKTKISGMQIYFTMEEIQEIFHGMDTLIFGTDYDYERSAICKSVISKCMKAQIKRLGTERPLKIFSDIKNDTPSHTIVTRGYGYNQEYEVVNSKGGVISPHSFHSYKAAQEWIDNQ